MSAPLPRPWPEMQAQMPKLGAAELAALQQSVAEHGVQYPVLVMPDGRIIDGHHRWQFAMTAPVRVVDLPEDAAMTLGLALNLARRHLSGADLDDLHERLRANRERRRETGMALRSQGLSQREVARIVGVAQSRISTWESEEELRGGRIITLDNASTPPDNRRKVDEAQEREMADRIRAGASVSEVARSAGVARPTVRRAVARSEHPIPVKPRVESDASDPTPGSVKPRGSDAQRWLRATTLIDEFLKGLVIEGGTTRLARQWTPEQRERQRAALDSLINRLVECRDEIDEAARPSNVVAMRQG